MGTLDQTPESDVFHSDAIGTVVEVRPALGLAYLEDEKGREWTVTRSTSGVDFTAMATGQRLELAIGQYRTASFVRACHRQS